MAGTFYRDGKRIFWNVADPGNTVVINLDHEHYNEVVIEVGHPDAVVALLIQSHMNDTRVNLPGS